MFLFLQMQQMQGKVTCTQCVFNNNLLRTENLPTALALLFLYRVVIFHINDLIFFLSKIRKKNIVVWSHGEEKRNNYSSMTRKYENDVYCVWFQSIAVRRQTARNHDQKKTFPKKLYSIFECNWKTKML